jgi:hypothetical protein
MDTPTLDEEAAAVERQFADDAARLERIAEQIATLHDPQPEDWDDEHLELPLDWKAAGDNFEIA